MSMLILMNNEFNSLFRNTMQKLIGLKIKKNENKYIEIVIQVSIRIVASLISMYLLQFINTEPDIKKYVSYIGIFIFCYIINNN